MKFNLTICALITKTMEFFHGLAFLAALSSIGDIEYFGKPESTRRSNNGANVSFLTDVMQK